MGGLGVLGHVLMLGLVVVVGVVVAYGSVLVADRTLGDSVGPQHNSTLSPFMTVVGLVFGALLGSPLSFPGSSFRPLRRTSLTKRPP
jgi:hypothetical protein